jgi:hypothetical protein
MRCLTSGIFNIPHQNRPKPRKLSTWINDFINAFKNSRKHRNWFCCSLADAFYCIYDRYLFQAPQIIGLNLEKFIPDTLHPMRRVMSHLSNMITLYSPTTLSTINRAE